MFQRSLAKMTTSTEMPLEMEIGPFSVICRGCLSDSGEMKNMIEWGFAEDFYIFTDVPVLSSQLSGSSELLCSSCEESLNSCKQFRIQCQRSNLLLSDLGKRDTPKEITADTSPELKEHKIVHTMNATSLTIDISTLDMYSKIHIPCAYKCGSTFIKQSDLQSHLAKSHNIDIKKYRVELRYYCPHESCSHSHKNGKHFTGRKYLNQHLNKMHLGEKSTCINCRVNFSTDSAYQRHFKDCNVPFMCDVCNVQYKTHERLLVHLKRRHPDLHGEYKAQRKMDKSLKRVSETITKDAKKTKPDVKEKHVSDYIYDSPKRSFATQTFNPESSIKNDVALPSWVKNDQSLYEKSDDIDRNFSTIQTQTVFEDLLSLKSQNSEDDSIFFSETVSLSDIQTQTFPIEFGLSTRKETITSETQTRDHSPDLSIKETQTCYCHHDSPKLNFKLFDSIGSSPSNTNLTSTETQTADVAKFNGKSDVLLSFHSTETQTCFDEKNTDL